MYMHVAMLGIFWLRVGSLIQRLANGLGKHKDPRLPVSLASNGGCRRILSRRALEALSMGP